MSTEQHQYSFFGSLFDFSFSEFITTRLIRVIYVLGLIMIGIGALIIIAGGFDGGFLSGLMSIVLAGLVSLLGAMYLRVMMELMIVVFRIAENVAKIADRPGPFEH